MEPVLTLLVAVALQKDWPGWIGRQPYAGVRRSYEQSTTRTQDIVDPMETYIKLYGSKRLDAQKRIKTRTDDANAWPKWIGRPRTMTRPQSLR